MPRRKQDTDTNAPSPLNSKQEAFCREYLVDFNATQAAIRAGYSAKTASTRGVQLLRILKVQNRISELKAPVAKKLELSRDWLASQWMSMAKAKVADIYSDWFTLIPMDEIPKEVRDNIKSVTTRENPDGTRYVKVELYSKEKALEALERYLPDHDPNDGAGVTINIHYNGPPTQPDADADAE